MQALLYGATGYTGTLIARHARAQGLSLTLGGRNPAALAELGKATGFECRAFSLDDPQAVRRGVAGVRAVLNCAGPFSRTWRAVSGACIAGGIHYIDVTGEIDVFEGLAARGPEAAAAGVMLLPGAGFDVVPSDCLARYLAGRLPGARRLQLGISGSGPLSHGTATTAVENQARGGMIRRDGLLQQVPAAWRTREIDFGDGRPRTAVTIPWGDVATAWYSTGIPDIEVYAALPAPMIRAIRLGRHLAWLLRARWIRALQQRIIRSRPAGPSAEELARGRSHVWGRVEDAAGRAAEAVVRGPNGYQLTALAALHVLRRVADGDAPPGYQTPSSAYGADLVLELPGTARFDLYPGTRT